MKNELLAPNGKPTNLTAEQYKLVRTPAFLNWFGNWENDPESASKVIDDNGEPMVCYHGTNEYRYFRSTDSNEKVYLNPKKSQFVPRTTSGGVYFTSKVNVAEKYSDMDFVLECFLSLKNPKIIDGLGKDMSEIIPESSPITYGNNDSIIVKNTYDVIGGFSGNKYYISDIFIVQKSNQIKLADGTNTTFESKNKDIRFDYGGETKYTTPDYLVMFLGK
jgi:hypothetical protein